MNLVGRHKVGLGARVDLVRTSLMAVGGRTSSRILFRRSWVGRDRMSWGRSRRTVAEPSVVQRHTNTKGGENSQLERRSKLQGRWLHGHA